MGVVGDAGLVGEVGVVAEMRLVLILDGCFYFELVLSIRCRGKIVTITAM